MAHEPRRAQPGQEFGYTAADGSQRTIKANADGLIRPANADEVRILDSFSIPHARTVKASAPAKRASSKRKVAAKATVRPATAPKPLTVPAESTSTTSSAAYEKEV